MRWAILLILLATTTQLASATIIVTSEGMNHSAMVELTHREIPDEYLEEVDWLEYVSKDDWDYGDYIGYYYAWWGNNGECYNTKAFILVDHYLVEGLHHEVGHIYGGCILGDFSEGFANNFNKDYLREA